MINLYVSSSSSGCNKNSLSETQFKQRSRKSYKFSFTESKQLHKLFQSRWQKCYLQAWAPPKLFLFLSPVPFTTESCTGPGANSVGEHCFQLKINKILFLTAADTWISLFFHVRKETERSCSSSEMLWMFYRDWQVSLTHGLPGSVAICCPPSFLASI